jgi:hypothetical protein
LELEPEILLEITRATRESRENQKMTDDTTGDYKDSKKSLSVFDGERISYREWAIKFESFLSTKDCEEYIESYVDIPTKIKAKADEALEKEKREGTMEVFKGNKKALAYLVQYTTKHPLDMIYKSKSAYAAWKILEKKYDSKDTDGDLDSLFDKFSKCSLKSKKVDPDIWFTELDNISGKLKNVDPKYEKDSRQMIAHIKHNACDEYEEVIDNFKDIRAMDSTTMTQAEALKRLKKIVQGRWDSKFKPSENEQESEWDKGKLEGMKKTDVEEGYTRRRFMGNEETQPRPSRSMSTRSMTKEHATGDKYKVTGDTTAIPIVLGADDNSATIEKQNEVGTETVHFLFNTCIASDPGEPKTLKEAMESPDREYWIASITAEINNFISRGAWEFVKIDEVRKENRRPIPTKLVFKKKDEIDGTVRCKSRLVTLGFMQIPGVDYTEKFSPVATDASLKTLIAVTLFFQDDNWTICSLDVEAAFLEPLMDTPMYITIHDA